MSNVIQFPQGGRRVEIGQRYECIELIRDGDGPCSKFDGSEGYPQFYPGQQVEIVAVRPENKYNQCSVATPDGWIVHEYNADKLCRYFKRIR